MSSDSPTSSFDEEWDSVPEQLPEASIEPVDDARLDQLFADFFNEVRAAKSFWLVRDEVYVTGDIKGTLNPLFPTTFSERDNQGPLSASCLDQDPPDSTPLEEPDGAVETFGDLLDELGSVAFLDPERVAQEELAAELLLAADVHVKPLPESVHKIRGGGVLQEGRGGESVEVPGEKSKD